MITSMSTSRAKFQMDEFYIIIMKFKQNDQQLDLNKNWQGLKKIKNQILKCLVNFLKFVIFVLLFLHWNVFKMYKDSYYKYEIV